METDLLLLLPMFGPCLKRVNQQKIPYMRPLKVLYELEIFEDDVTKCTSLYELVDGITVVELTGYPR